MTISRKNNMPEYAVFVKNKKTNGSEVKLGSYDGAWYAEQNGTTFVIISQMLMQ